MSRSCNNHVSSQEVAEVGVYLGVSEKKPDSKNGIFTQAEWNQLSDKLGLSPRQSQVANLLLMGLSDKQIASKLDISTHTLRTYLDRMFTKMSVGDRCELIVHIFREFRSGCGSACPRNQ